MCEWLFRDFTTYQLRRNLASETARRRAGWLRKAEWLLDSCVLDADFDALEDIIDPRLAPATRYWRMSCFASFFRWAIRQGHTTYDPTVRMDRPRLPRRLPRPIVDAELADALAGADLRELAVLSLAAFCGLRRCEVAWLTTDRVLPNPSRLYITGKGGHERVVPLHPFAESSLHRYGITGYGPVIRRRDDRLSGQDALTPDTVGKIANDRLTAVGSDATIHQLRHHYATAVYEETGDLGLVQTLLGHADIGTTKGYSKVSIGDSAYSAVYSLPVPTSTRDDTTHATPEPASGVTSRSVRP